MWFDNWSDIIRVLVTVATAYVTLVVILRVSGKRTLAKLNAFDFVVTVALGSTLATIVLNTSVSWSEGAAALAGLALLQFAVALVTSHLPWARKIATAQPTFLVRDGRLLPEALSSQRVAETEVRQALRQAGFGGLEQVDAVVLETDGTLSIVSAKNTGTGWAYDDVN